MKDGQQVPGRILVQGQLTGEAQLGDLEPQPAHLATDAISARTRVRLQRRRRRRRWRRRRVLHTHSEITSASSARHLQLSENWPRERPLSHARTLTRRRTPPDWVSSGAGRTGTRSFSGRRRRRLEHANNGSVVHGIDINILLPLAARWLRATAGSLTPPGVGGPPAQGAPPARGDETLLGWVREKRQKRPPTRHSDHPRDVYVCE